MARPVRFNIHPKQTDIHDNIALADMPEGEQGEGYFATSFEKIVGLARKNSIWPLPFATSLLWYRIYGTMGAHYDLARFGSERLGIYTAPMRFINGDGNDCKKNGSCFKTGLSANG